MDLSPSQLGSLLTTRYIIGVSVTLTLYDHGLNLQEELDLIWLGRWSVLSAFVLLDLYVREIGMIFIATVTGGFVHMSRHTCTIFSMFAISYGVWCTISAHTIVFFRVYRLWDDRKKVSWALIVGFCACFGATIVFTVLAGVQVLAGMRYVASVNICSFEDKSWYTTGIWAPMVLYDSYVLVLVFVNVLSRPRRENSQLATMLYRDGFIMFLGFFALRVARLLSSIFTGAEDVFIAPMISWALEAVLARRLFMWVKGFQSESGNVYLWNSSQKEPPGVSAGRLPLVSTVQVWEEVEMHLL